MFSLQVNPHSHILSQTMTNTVCSLEVDDCISVQAFIVITLVSIYAFISYLATGWDFMIKINTANSAIFASV